MVSPRPTSPPPARGLDQQALFAIEDLELRARVVVEGLWSGLQRSPSTGFSVEFTEYRQYSPGDDLRYLDWRALARTDRHYLKRFEDETNLRCQLLVDTSRSMDFASGRVSKAQYARTLAATLSYFLLKQRDVVGLATFSHGLEAVVPARWRPGHWRHLLALLDRAPKSRETRLDLALEQIAPIWRRRSLVVLLSDFLSPPAEWDLSLGRLAAAGHDVRAIQIVDPAELSLDFGKSGIWEDLETGRQLYINPSQARSAYTKKFQAHQDEVVRTLRRRGVAYTLAPLDRPLDFVLLEFLRAKEGASNPRRRRRR